MPYFKDWNGVIYGTHVNASFLDVDKVACIDCGGKSSQNVLAIYDFKMNFTYILVGWEGCTHDNWWLKYALRSDDKSFSHPPNDKYYLVDVGFTLQRGLLKSFQNMRYHILNFQHSI